MESMLAEYWLVAISLIASTAFSATVFRGYFRNSKNISITIADLFLFIALSSWMLSYALATRLEIHSISISFGEKETVGPDFTILLYAVLFAFGFSFLLIFHRYTYLVFVLVFVVGMADISGNSFLIEGAVTNVALNKDYSSSPPWQRIWLYYYVDGGHLMRISIYLAVSLTGASFLYLSHFRYANLELIADGLSQKFASTIGRVVRWSVIFSIASRLALVIAIFLNEYLVWETRLDRERMLKCYDRSGFFETSFARRNDPAFCGDTFEEFGFPRLHESGPS